MLRCAPRNILEERKKNNEKGKRKKKLERKEKDQMLEGSLRCSLTLTLTRKKKGGAEMCTRSEEEMDRREGKKEGE